MDAVSILVLLCYELFLEIIRVFGSLFELKFIDFLSDLGSNGSILWNVGILILLDRIEAAISVSSKSSALFGLPSFNEALNSLKNEVFFLIREFTILAHGIQTDDILLVLSLEGGESNLWPFFLLGLELKTLSDSLVTLGILLSLPLDALRILLETALLNILPVCNRMGKRLVKKTALVNKRHSHEASESWNSLIMHTGLTNYLFHINMLEALHQRDLSVVLISISIDRSVSFSLTDVLLSKHIVGDTLGRIQHSALNEFVIFVCMDEFDDLRLSGILMSLVIIIDLDAALRELKAANVDSSGTSVLLKEVNKRGKVVGKIVRLFERRKEVGLDILVLNHSFSLLLLLTIIDALANSLAVFLRSNLLKLCLSLRKMKMQFSNGVI